jgi:hypothetical protein
MPTYLGILKKIYLCQNLISMPHDEIFFAPFVTIQIH